LYDQTIAYNYLISYVLDMSQLEDYNTFEYFGLGAKSSEGYKKVLVHLIFDVVDNGQLTDIPVNSVYSGVVLLQGI